MYPVCYDDMFDGLIVYDTRIRWAGWTTSTHDMDMSYIPNILREFLAVHYGYS